MSNPIQFNFELPEPEATRLLDVGVARRMGLTRETVSRAMISRALVMERLDELSPRAGAPAPELAEFIAKLSAAYTASPRVLAKMQAVIIRELRAKPEPGKGRAAA